MLVEKLLEKYGVVMGPNDVAEVLHQHPNHIRDLCREGKLPAVQIGQRWHVNTARFAAILEGFNE